jgi:hypothetical protein
MSQNRVELTAVQAVQGIGGQHNPAVLGDAGSRRFRKSVRFWAESGAWEVGPDVPCIRDPDAGTVTAEGTVKHSRAPWGITVGRAFKPMRGSGPP